MIILLILIKLFLMNTFWLVSVSNRTGEERRWQTLRDKRDNRIFGKLFRQTWPSFEQVFSENINLSEGHHKRHKS